MLFNVPLCRQSVQNPTQPMAYRETASLQRRALAVNTGFVPVGYSIIAQYYLAPPSIYVKNHFGDLALGCLVLVAKNEYHTPFLAQAA